MKQTLLHTTVLFLLATCTYAQITVTSASFPGLGDTLLTAVDNLPSGIVITPSGGAQSWSYVSLEAPFNQSRVMEPAIQGPGAFAYPNADFYSSFGEGVVAYYSATGSEIEILGLYGEDPIGLGLETVSRFEPPLVMRRAPLNYLDDHQNEYNIAIAVDADDIPFDILDNLPITPDSIRIRANTTRYDLVDAWGTLTIPGGIYDVLREKRTEYRELRLDAKVPILGWVDITDVAIEALQLENLGQDTSISYHFYSNDAIEPIAVVEVNNDETFVQRVEFKGNTVTSNLQTLSELKPGVYAFPNPAIVNARFEFANLPKGRYELKILNILGVEEWSKTYTISGNYTDKVDISSLSKGTFLYSLTNEQGKILSTRRLVVIRP
jgi:hypothetical protein